MRRRNWFGRVSRSNRRQCPGRAAHGRAVLSRWVGLRPRTENAVRGRKFDQDVLAKLGLLSPWRSENRSTSAACLHAKPQAIRSQVDGGPVQLGSLIRISLKSGAIVDLEAMRGEPGEEFQIELRNRTDGS